MFIQIPENPNCQTVDGQVFQCRSPSRTVTHIRIEHAGSNEWRAITGLDAGGNPCPATACIIEDSGEGECYLVIGGDWGLRLQGRSVTSKWSLEDLDQWGEPFLLMGGDGSDLRFQD